MNRIVKSITLSTMASSVLMAGGYKIPEQSLNSMAKAGANVAYTTGADSSYDNPANMSFLDESKSYLEGGLTLVHLPSNIYTLGGPYSGESKAENLPLPFFHYVSEAMGDFRWGVSLAVPGGLTKRWETPFQKAFVEDFTLKVIELNPTVAYKLMDNVSVGAGVRLIYSEGIVKSNGTGVLPGDPSRDMEGDTIEFGYNLAITYKPTDDINIAATYRSKIDLNEEGTAKINAGPLYYDGAATVSVPLPAALNLAISKTWNDQFTLEFNYERTYWSAYETLEFGYTGTNNAYIPDAFRQTVKNWKDTNTFRVGATLDMDHDLTLMLGFAIDESPVPANTLGFETPDTDAKILSIGVNYKQTENLSWGVAFLYDNKKPITIEPGSTIAGNPILENGGRFTGGGAFLTTLGMAYEF